MIAANCPGSVCLGASGGEMRYSMAKQITANVAASPEKSA
jgi:hypothetical protein